MSTRFVFDGLDELKAQLRALPAELGGEAGNIIEGATNSAEQKIKAAYSRHRLTGELAEKTQATVTRTAFGAEGIVKNTSKLAHIFEKGSEVRHYVTVRGNQHVTGRMPAAHVFAKVMPAERRRMWQQIRDLLVRHGLIVSGEP